MAARSSKRNARKSPAAPSKPAPAVPEVAASDPRVLPGLIVLGLVARIALALVSRGTVDSNTFYKFGSEVTHNGLLHSYRSDNDLNHPPIPVYWATAVYRLTESQTARDYLAAVAQELKRGRSLVPGEPMEQRLARRLPPEKLAEFDRALTRDAYRFTVLFKLPVILADAAAAWLLWRIWRRRAEPRDDGGGGPQRGLVVAAAFAWALAAVLVSGYHCNTDPIYAFLCLLCVYLIADRGRHFWAGVALAAAINVKITPVLLIPPLLLAYRRPGHAARFVAGLSLGVIPFLPLLWFIGPRFYQNAIAYNSNIEKWGVNFFLLWRQGDELAMDPTRLWEYPAYVFYRFGRYLVFALVFAWALAARLRRRWDPYEVAAVTFVISLVFTGGFGLQYVVIPLPLLFAVRPRFAFAYAAAAGLFLAGVYFTNWTGEFPLYSHPRGMFPWPTPLLGLVPWGMLMYYLARTVVWPGQAARDAVGFPVRPLPRE